MSGEFAGTICAAIGVTDAVGMTERAAGIIICLEVIAMEKIVYILGAGFSAPLGLPVMSNFLEKSKDQFALNPSKYAHFERIFQDELKQVHVASDHYQTNVFNIEDILSILEFRARLDNSGDGEQRLERFKQYLKDVIEFYTPLNTLLEQTDVFVKNEWDKYIAFVAEILNFDYKVPLPSAEERMERHVRGWSSIKSSPEFVEFDRTNYRYSVITFNYDLVLESIQKHLETFKSPRRFHKEIVLDDPRNQIHFAKLHGSIDGEIIPPTWNKGLNPNMLNDWKVAYKVLSDANQIRILGYSLPLTDTYFRFLLRATVIDNPHLRWIDVICKDDDGNVKKSYDEFVKYPKYRFVARNTEDYLNLSLSAQYSREGLEVAHEKFFAERG